MGNIYHLFNNLWSVKAPVTNLGLVVRRPGDAPEIVLPSTGPITLVSGIPFGTFGAWTPVATPTNDTFINQVAARRRAMYPGIGALLLELGQGAGPTALDAFRQDEFIVDPNAEDAGFPPIGAELTWYTRIPAGQSLQARISEQTGTQTWDLLLTAYDTGIPVFTTINKPPSGIGSYNPTNISSGVTPTSGIYPNFGAWTQVIASAPTQMVVRHISPAFSAGDVQRQLNVAQIGIGAVGSEIAIATLILGRGQSWGVIDPPVWVKTGERLVVRTMSTSAAGYGILVKTINL